MANIMKRNGGTTPATFGGLLDNVVQNTLSRFMDDDFWGFDGITAQSRVPVNIRETGNSYEMEFVAPGLRKEDFSVNIGDNMLTISFEHKEEAKEGGKGEGYLRNEYKMRSFSRSFNLDDTVDAEKITAQYRDSILYLTLPKKPDAQRITKSIQVQ